MGTVSNTAPSTPPRPALADQLSTAGRPRSADKKEAGQHGCRAIGVKTRGLFHSTGSVTKARGRTGRRFKNGDVYSRR